VSIEFCGSGDRDEDEAGKIMLLKLLQNKLFIMVIGAVVFWGPFLVSIFILKDVATIFLTFIAPILMFVVTLKYKSILNQHNLPFKDYYCFLIGLIGPLIPCLLFFVPMFFQIVREKGIIEVVKASLYIPLGIISVLTYSGMLGAMVINIILFSVLSLIIKDKPKTI